MTRTFYLPPWRIDLTVRDGVVAPTPSVTLARVAARALEATGAPPPATLAITLSGDDELASLNAEHMAGSGPTDVLSFPLLPPTAFPDHPGKGGRASRSPRFVLPPGTRTHLGDIVVSVERAAAQAEEGRGGQTGDVRWSAADELRLLVVHGVLHICGWDHADEVERETMRALEQRILDQAR